MPFSQVQRLSLALDAILAEKYLFELNVFNFAKLKKPAREKIVRGLKKRITGAIGLGSGRLATYNDILKKVGALKDG